MGYYHIGNCFEEKGIEISEFDEVSELDDGGLGREYLGFGRNRRIRGKAWMLGTGRVSNGGVPGNASYHILHCDAVFDTMEVSLE